MCHMEQLIIRRDNDYMSLKIELFLSFNILKNYPSLKKTFFFLMLVID